MLSIIPKLQMNHNSVQLLEFKYILEDQTFKPWLIKIDSDIHLHFNSDEIEASNIKENENKTTRGVTDFKDMIQFCLLFRIFSKLENRLSEIKHREVNEEQTEFERLYNTGRPQNSPSKTTDEKYL